MQASDTHADIYIMMLTVSPIKLCICSSRVFINPFIKVDILSFFFYVKTYKLETKASFLRPQWEEWVTNNLTGRHSRYHLPNKKMEKYIICPKAPMHTIDNLFVKFSISNEPRWLFGTNSIKSIELWKIFFLWFMKLVHMVPKAFAGH